MIRKRSNEKKDVPLHLLAVAIARQVRKAGKDVYRISVRRTHWHYYNISIRTKLSRRAHQPAEVATAEAGESVQVIDIPVAAKETARKRKPGCTVCK